jgi:phosphoglycolate phosphatase
VTRLPGSDPLEAVLFDLDGTLVDSAEDLREALNEVLAEEGLRPLAAGEVTAMIGDGVLKLLERGLARTGGEIERAGLLLPRFLALYTPRASRKTRPYPGVVETLGSLRTAGIRIAVVTNKPEAATAEILRVLGLARFVDAVVGGDTLPHRKPHPAPLVEALRRVGVGASAAVMVGDNRHDVEAARAAGLKTVLVSYGYAHGPPRELGADTVIDRFADLPAALERLISRPGASS